MDMAKNRKISWVDKIQIKKCWQKWKMMMNFEASELTARYYRRMNEGKT